MINNLLLLVNCHMMILMISQIFYPIYPGFSLLKSRVFCLLRLPALASAGSFCLSFSLVSFCCPCSCSEACSSAASLLALFLLSLALSSQTHLLLHLILVLGTVTVKCSLNFFSLYKVLNVFYFLPDSKRIFYLGSNFPFLTILSGPFVPNTYHKL